MGRVEVDKVMENFAWVPCARETSCIWRMGRESTENGLDGWINQVRAATTLLPKGYLKLSLSVKESFYQNLASV